MKNLRRKRETELLSAAKQVTRLRIVVTALLILLGINATVERAAAQSSPCGHVQTIPANSPPVQYTISNFWLACCNLSFQDYLTSYNVTSAQPWATVTRIGPLSGPDVTSQTLTFDVTGLSPGTYCAQFPASVSAVSTAPSCPGCILSGSATELHQIVVTATPAVLLVDPVPDLVAGNAVKTSSQLQNLLTKGRTVSGIAADGVTQVVVRVDTNYPAHQFALTLVGDQGLSGASIIPSEDGALDLPGNSGFPSGQLTITAGAADSNGMAHAFAVYRAPIDFARPSGSGFKSGTCQGSTKPDDQIACRTVSLQVQDITANSSLPTTSITIVRPPVFLIHGLWGDWKAWNNFAPLVTGKTSVDARFHVERVSYDWDVGSQISSSNPQYTASMSSAKANSLGVQYVTPFVLTQIANAIAKFRAADNPVSLPVAGVQADIVAHSMGGVVTRTLPLQAGFLSNTLGQGIIHKVISIDVPHLGSPLAALLLDSTADCTREILAGGGNFSFRSANLSNAPSTPVSGAVGDMVNSRSGFPAGHITYAVLAGKATPWPRDSTVQAGP